MEQTRTCRNCHRTLPVSTYGSNLYRCKECHSDYHREYRKKQKTLLEQREEKEQISSELHQNMDNFIIELGPKLIEILEILDKLERLDKLDILDRLDKLDKLDRLVSMENRLQRLEYMSQNK